MNNKLIESQINYFISNKKKVVEKENLKRERKREKEREKEGEKEKGKGKGKGGNGDL